MMSGRLRLARFLLQLAEIIESLPISVMKPDDLVEFSRQTYAKPDDVESWSKDEIVDSGLSFDETELLDAMSIKTGNLLLLGIGGGREAIPLAKMGFHVTGVDYVPAMVARAKENVAQRGVEITGLVQEISRLEVQESLYDVVLISRSMYSCVPTRVRRVEMVRRIAHALKPGGYFLCQFHWNAVPKYSPKMQRLHRVVAALTQGNTSYEEGDMLWLNVEFIHAFSSEDAVRSELEEGGLIVERLKTKPSSIKGYAVCRKSVEISQ